MIKRNPVLGMIAILSFFLIISDCGGGGGGGGGVNMSITRELATQIVIDKVISNIPAAERVNLVAFSPMDPLKPGTMILPAFPEYNAETEESIGYKNTKTLDRYAWFFYVDTDYQMRFSHNTIFVFVYNDGTLETQEQEWWPVIDNKAFLWNTQLKKNTNLRIYPNVNPYDHTVTEKNPPITSDKVSVAFTILKIEFDNYCYVDRGAWLIKGGDDSDFQADVDDMSELMTDSAVDGGFQVPSDSIFNTEGRDVGNAGTAQTIIDEWNLKVQEINQALKDAKKVCYKEFFVYYTGHGPQTGGFALGNSEDSDTVINIPSLIRIINKICAKKIILIIDSCYAGLWIESLKRTDVKRCADYVILTSSASNKKAKSMDFGFYTSAFSKRIRAQNMSHTDEQLPLDDKLEMAHGNTLGTVYQWGAPLIGYETYGIWEQDPRFDKTPKNTTQNCCDCTCGVPITTSTIYPTTSTTSSTTTTSTTTTITTTSSSSSTTTIPPTTTPSTTTTTTPTTTTVIPSLPPSLIISPGTFSIVHVIGSSPCPTPIGTMTITGGSNPGGNPITYTITGNPAWLSVSPTTGSVASGSPANVSLSFTCAGWACGANTATITITGKDPANNLTTTMNAVVTVTVTGPPCP
jgi:hypothetical protein